MKPLKERLSIIDAAIEYHKGKWPEFTDVNGFYWFNSTGVLCRNDGTSDSVKLTKICTRQEFEQRAKELGWVNGYKFGVEYETNGKKPDLPDDLRVSIISVRWEGFGGLSTSVGEYDWGYYADEKFILADPRYKPKEQNMNDWYEKGENPPVGTVCELLWGGVSQGDVEIIAYRNNGNKVIFWRIDKDHVDSAEIPTAEFRPLRSERDTLIEAAEAILDGCENVSNKAIATAFVNLGWRPTKEEE